MPRAACQRASVKLSLRPRKALHAAGQPLPKREIAEHTGMSDGQITPTLKAMEQHGIVTFTETHWNAKNQRYALSGEQDE